MGKSLTNDFTTELNLNSDILVTATKQDFNSQTNINSGPATPQPYYILVVHKLVRPLSDDWA